MASPRRSSDRLESPLPLSNVISGPDEPREERPDPQHAGVLHRRHLHSTVPGNSFIRSPAQHTDTHTHGRCLSTCLFGVNQVTFLSLDPCRHIGALLAAAGGLSDQPPALEASVGGMRRRSRQRPGVTPPPGSSPSSLVSQTRMK